MRALVVIILIINLFACAGTPPSDVSQTGPNTANKTSPNTVMEEVKFTLEVT